MLVAAVVGALVLAGGGGAGPSFSQRETPEFSFSVAKATGTSAAEDVKDPDLVDEATAVATDIAPIFDTLFTEAFLDPENLLSGTYDDVWTSFDAGAVTDAQAAVETLTLGAYGKRFTDVQPEKGTLRARVLFDAAGAPTLVVVTIAFDATAEPGAAQGPATIVSRGQFLLEGGPGAWRIVAFRADRADSNMPSLTPSGSPS